MLTLRPPRFISAAAGITGGFEAYYNYGGASSSTITFSGVDIGSASAGRFVVVAFSQSDALSFFASSVTINGVSASALAQFSAGGNPSRSEIWGATVASGTSVDVVITFSNSVSDITLGVWALLGANTTALDTDGGVTGSGYTVNTADNGFVIAVATSGNPTASFTWTNATEQYDTTPSSRIHSGADAITTAGTLTVTATPNSASSTSSCAVASLQPA